ncbi:MAG: hypothetical protein EBT05_10235 [Betaproteobacteria bacterium]|nr:hypothetical protein [Betaproteobacteria bacterium]
MELPSRTYRVGVDIGGTFTDVVVVEENSGEVFAAGGDPVRCPRHDCRDQHHHSRRRGAGRTHHQRRFQ